jgi:hypothetical protein
MRAGEGGDVTDVVIGGAGVEVGDEPRGEAAGK